MIQINYKNNPSNLNYELFKPDDSSFELSEIAQFVFKEYYLKPFNRTTEVSLNPKHFEVLDEKIFRVTHGAMHAARVAAYIKIIHHFRCLHDDPASIKFEKVAESVNCSITQLIHLTQIAGLFHDAARQDEGEDRWDAQSAEICFQFLKQGFTSIPNNVAELIANTIGSKDNKAEFLQKATLLNFTTDQALDLDYLRQLVHDADCLDIMRIRKTFRMRFLDLTAASGLEHAPSSILELALQVKDLIHEQGDLYQGCQIEVSHSTLKNPEFSPANFDRELKFRYESDSNVYSRVTADMKKYSFLKLIDHPD